MFGGGGFGEPMAFDKILPEDYVTYSLYVDPDAFPNDVSKEEYLHAACASYLGFIRPHIEGYIWQEQPFELKVQPSSAKSEACLVGRTRFGDNIDVRING